jgi:hypothetical protein
MAESGLSVHPMKGKKRKNVSFKTCTILPIFDAEKDVNHVSLVATAALGGESLIPLILMTCDLTFKSDDLAILRRTLAAYCTPRGDLKL